MDSDLGISKESSDDRGMYVFIGVEVAPGSRSFYPRSRIRMHVVPFDLGFGLVYFCAQPSYKCFVTALVFLNEYTYACSFIAHLVDRSFLCNQ